MYFVSRSLGGCLALFLLATRASGVEDSELMKRVESELPKAARALVVSASRMHGSGIEVEEKGAAGHQAEWKSGTTRYEFHVDGLSKRLDVFPRRDEYDSEHPFSYTWCCTPSASFASKRPTKSSSQILILNTAGLDATIDKKIGTYIDKYLKSTLYSYANLDMSVLLARPDFKPVDATYADENERRLVKISYVFNLASNKDPTPRAIPIAVFLSPEDGWILREYRVGKDKSPTEKSSVWGKIEYRDGPDGSPIPKRVTLSERKSLRTFDFEEVIYGPSPASVFTYESAGFPDLKVTAAARPSKSRAGYWFVGVAGLAFVLAVVLKALALRKPKTGAIGPPSGT